MFRYGDKVIIRDGSMLDGSVGIVYRVNDNEVQVLLDREVFWIVSETRLEQAGLDSASAVTGKTGG